MVSAETNLPDFFDVGAPAAGKTPARPARNVKWSARLGSHTYGNPTVAAGRVFVGTNNNGPRDGRFAGDRGVVVCLGESDGQVLWKLVIPKLPQSGPLNCDSPDLGICSAPAVEGGRVYLVSSRGEVLCLDVEGLANGNDGPFTDEAVYMAHPKKTEVTAGPKGPIVRITPGEPVELKPTDGDIIWRFDMIGQVGTYPEDASSCSVLIVGDLLFVGTGNGVDSHKTPFTAAPSLIALDKHTGRLLAVDKENIGPRVYEGQWSSPALASAGGRKLVVYGAGDGVCYAFDAELPAAKAGEPATLRKIWGFDCNPPEVKFRDGKPIPYKEGSNEGPSGIIGTPVFHDGRVYVTVGQDPLDGTGPGCLSCIDAATGQAVWQYKALQRSLSTVSVADGLVYVADYSGLLHCVDAETGKAVWTHKVGPTWSSAFVADGKVYMGTEKGELFIFAAGRRKKLLNTVRLGSAICATPVAANGVLLVPCDKYLYAVQAPSEQAKADKPLKPD